MHILVAGYRIKVFRFVAELVKSFDSPSFSKVLTIRHGGTFSFRYKIGHRIRRRGLPTGRVSLIG